MNRYSAIILGFAALVVIVAGVFKLISNNTPNGTGSQNPTSSIYPNIGGYQSQSTETSLAQSKQAVQAAFQAQIPPGQKETLYDTAISGNYALQSWGDTNEGGEALLHYDLNKNAWSVVNWGGGTQNVVSLTEQGVPADNASALIAGMSR